MDQLFIAACSLMARGWYDFFKDFSSAFIAAIFGGIAAWIAYNQWKTASNKLKFDLYEKRVKIYDLTIEQLGRVMGKANVEFEHSTDFIRSVNAAKFLFEQDIYEYVYMIYKKSIELKSLNEQIKESNGEKRKDLIKKKHDILLWFVNQYDEVDKKFTKYIRLVI